MAIVNAYQTAESGKFKQFPIDDTSFPAVSVTRVGYYDASSAFPGNTGSPTYSAVDVYPKYAVLTHLTNTSDISLSAGNLNIGSVTIKDNDTGAIADVVTDNGLNALRVVTQDLESTIDDITIGDRQGNFATVNASASSLNVSVTNLQGIPISYADGPNLDAFGRLRVSEPKTLVDAKHLYDKLPLVFAEKLSGTATSTFSAGDSMVVMSTNAAGDFAARQTRYHFNYQPGKSLQAFFTGKVHPQVGIIKRMGLYQSLSADPSTPTDGLYLEVTENGPCFHITKTQGTPHAMSFPQSDWNVDKLDGTGPSGITIAMSAAQIFVIDYEWLSLGRIRFGFMQSGKTYYAHYVDHINDLDRPYITSPNQPIRYEIVQTGATPGVMHHICSTVMVEGGEDSLGKPISVTDGVVTSIGSSDYKALLAVRLKPTAHDSSVVIRTGEVLNTGGQPAMYDIILNPTYVSSPFTWTDVPSAAIQYSTGGATVSGGYSLFRSFVAAGLGGATISNSLATPGEITKLGVSIDEEPDTVVLVGKTLVSPGTTSMIGLFNLLERS